MRSLQPKIQWRRPASGRSRVKATVQGEEHTVESLWSDQVTSSVPAASSEKVGFEGGVKGGVACMLGEAGRLLRGDRQLVEGDGGGGLKVVRKER